jgi:hypothetical protein
LDSELSGSRYLNYSSARFCILDSKPFDRKSNSIDNNSSLQTAKIGDYLIRNSGLSDKKNKEQRFKAYKALALAVT